MYTGLCLFFGYALLVFRLPEAMLYVMAVPLLFTVTHYSGRVVAALFSVLTAVALSSALLFSSNYVYSAITLSAAFVTSLFAVVLLRRMLLQHRRAEKAAGELLRIAADLSPAFDYWQKPDGSIGYISPACRRVIGYDPEEIAENPQMFYDLIHPEDRARVMHLCMQGRRRSEELRTIRFRFTRRDGQQRWMEQVCQQVFSEKGEFLGKRASNTDITERKEAEDALKYKLERVSLALEGGHEAVWDIDLVSGVAYFSPHYLRLLGIDPEQQPLKLQDIYKRVHSEDLPRVVKAFKAYLRDEADIYQVEYRLRFATGAWRWVRDRGRIIARDNTGKPTRMAGTHVDITQLKELEEALQASEMRFRQLTENMREIFWLRERASRHFIYISPAFSDVWGRSLESLKDNPNLFIEGIHHEDLGRVFHAQKELLEFGRALDMEFRVLRPDGTMRWVWCREYPVYDQSGKYYRTAGVVEDITARKEADTNLKDSERRYRALIENQGGGVSIVDPNDRIVYINPAGEDIFGVTRGTLMGRNMKEFLSEDQIKVLHAQSALRRQGVESSYELTITRPDGETRNLLLTATPRFDVNNQFLGAITIFRDISQRKQNEERLLYMSLHDSLTGLHNRAYFEEEMIKLDQSDLYPISVIMVDVDGLKAVNDQMGHAQGDDLLVRVAKILKASIRTQDSLARLGGDEFAILMPETDEKALKQVMTRIFDNLEAENQTHESPYLVSLSAGGAVCTERGKINEAISEADARMYQAKEQKKRMYFINLPFPAKGKPTE